jgi:hypothetical protein
LREERAVVDIKGPFHEGDVVTIPFDFLDVPTVTMNKDHYLNGYTHYVVLDKLGWWGRRFRLRGIRGKAHTLHLPLPRLVVIESSEAEEEDVA